jgi:SAM-dependent methyltransferase
MAKEALRPAKVGSKDKRSNRETNLTILRQAMMRRLPRRIAGNGQLHLPAAPALLDHYTDLLIEQFGELGRTFSKDERAHLRGILERKLAEAYKASPASRVLVTWETDPPPKTSLSYRMSVVNATVTDEFAAWKGLQPSPSERTAPDEKVLSAARSFGDPKDVPVLDIGSGTSQNVLALARLGYPADAVELSPQSAAELRSEVEKAGLSVRVFEAQTLATQLELPERHYKLVLLTELLALHIREPSQIRALFEGAAESLSSGGLLLFAVFLSREGYRPEALERELSHVSFCNLFQRGELESAMQGLPFELVADESAYDFESEHRTPEARPPTSWFPDWARGLELYDLPVERVPAELRWMSYRRR